MPCIFFQLFTLSSFSSARWPLSRSSAAMATSWESCWTPVDQGTFPFSYRNLAVDEHGIDMIQYMTMEHPSLWMVSSIFGWGFYSAYFQWDYLSTQLHVPWGATPQHPKWDGKASRMGYSNEGDHRSSHRRDRRFDEDIKKKEEETRQKAGWRWLGGGLPRLFFQMLCSSRRVSPRCLCWIPT